MDDKTAIADLFSLVPVAPTARDEVIALMSARDRHYHDINHLAQLWHHLLLYGIGRTVTEAPWQRLIASTIAFHDAIYDPTRRDNETRSADLWRDASPVLEPWEVEWVAGTILATADHLGAVPELGKDPEAWAARLWVLDLDLSPLAATDGGFDANTAKLRAEYAHLDDAAWNAGRLGFLRTLSRWPLFFRTPVLAAAFEAKARANMARELAGAEPS